MNVWRLFFQIHNLFGFNRGSTITPLPEEIDTLINSDHNILSTTAPEIMPSSSYIVNCNLVNNELSINRRTLSSFTIPNNTGFGDLIDASSTPVYSKIYPGEYNVLELEIVDQDYRPLMIRDPNMLINLSIIKTSE